eukprot:3308307-Alexandrium_andersonii.AAC.1
MPRGERAGVSPRSSPLRELPPYPMADPPSATDGGPGDAERERTVVHSPACAMVPFPLLKW